MSNRLGPQHLSLFAILSMATIPLLAGPFFDDFDSGADARWTPIRGAWSVHEGTYAATGAGFNFSRLPYVVKDATIEVDVHQVADGGIWLHCDANGTAGIILITGGNGWGFGDRGGPAGRSLYWHRVTPENAGHSPILNEVTGVFPNPGKDSAHLRIEIIGNFYAAFLDGSSEPITTYLDEENLYPSGYVGLYDFSDQSFDHFRLETDAVPTDHAAALDWRWQEEGVELHWLADPDLVYTLNASLDLGTWEAIAEPVADVSGLLAYAIETPAPGAFFRLELEEDMDAGEEELDEELRPFETAEPKVAKLELAPMYPEPGEETEVTIWLANEAENAVAAIEVEMLIDGVLNARTAVAIPALGETLVTIPWIPDTAGEHTLSVRIDPLAEIPQYRRADDTRSETVVVAAPAPGADFRIDYVEQLRDEGELVALQVGYSATDGGRSIVPLELIDESGNLLVVKAAAFEDGAALGEVVFPWPANRRLGSIEVKINPQGLEAEPDAEDNIWQGDFGLPVDLAIERLSLHSVREPVSGDRRVTASFRVVNVGSTDVTVPFAVQSLAHVDDGSGTLVEVQLEASAIDRLDRGEAVYFSHIFAHLPVACEISAEVDPLRALADTDRTNNHARQAFTNTPPTPGRWVSLGPSYVTSGLGSVGRVHHIAIAAPTADDRTIYVGAPTGSHGDPGGSGIWKSTDAGASWAPVADALPSLSVLALAIDPSDSDRLYLATNEGFYRSPDGGRRWERLSTSFNSGGQTYLVVHPTDPQRLFITDGTGIARSTDGGAHWTTVLSGGKGHDLTLDPKNPDRVLATLFESNKMAGSFAAVGVWESRSRGDPGTWRKLIGCPGGELPVMTTYAKVYLTISQDRLYAGFQTDRFRLYRTTAISCSTNGIVENFWEKAWDTDTKISRIEADPSDPDRIYAHYVGGHFWSSDNGGQRFTRTREIHMDHHAFAFDPIEPRILYTGSDGGLFRSDNYGRQGSWSFVGRGILNMEVYDLANAPTDPDLMVIGTQDNGTSLTRGTLGWEHIRGGDGSTCGVHPADANILFDMKQFSGSIEMRDHGTASSIGCGLSIKEARDFRYLVHPVVVDGQAVLYAPYGSLLRRWNGATCTARPDHKVEFGSPNNWEIIMGVNEGAVECLGCDPSPVFNDGYLYAGTTKGTLYAAEDADWGSHPLPVFTHPKGWAVSDIAVSPHSSRDVFVSFNSLNGIQRVYHLRRKEAPSQADFFDFATPIGNNLPPVVVRCLAVDPAIAGAGPIYVGTNRGVWRGRPQTVAGRLTWLWDDFSSGMPEATDVSDLEAVEDTRLIRAATLGRGVYQVVTPFP